MTEIAKRDDAALSTALASSPNVVALLHEAVAAKLPVDALEKLVELHERVTAGEAKKAFARDLAEFQRTCPAVPRTSNSKKRADTRGATFDFKYAEKDQIIETVGPFLYPLGFSFSWDTEEREKGIAVICTLRHKDGHASSATCSIPTDSTLPISMQQKIGAARSYGERYSLSQVLGIVTTDPESADQPGDLDPITEEQAQALEEHLRALKATDADRAKFLQFLGAASVPEIVARDFYKAKLVLVQKLRIIERGEAAKA